MKNKKQLISLIIAGLLCLTIAFAVLAEGRLLTMWNAGSKLLFDTDNVSLTGHAAFSYDGEWFKTFDGRYQQDGVNSYMQVMLDTPMEDGSVYTGGYTVIGEGSTVYSIETYRPRIYQDGTTLSNPSILTNTVMRNSLMRFGGLLLDLMEDRMQDAITETVDEAGTHYHIALQEGNTPEAANAALTMLMHLIAKEYLYIDLDETYFSQAIDTAYVKDYDALFAAEYEKAFNEPMPEDFYDLLWDEKGGATEMLQRSEQISERIGELIAQADDQYDHGVALVMNDGSVHFFESYEAYIMAEGYEDVRFENYAAAFRAFYEKKTGAPMTQEMSNALSITNNQELIDKYIDMLVEMENDYFAQLRALGRPCGMVNSKGELIPYDTVAELDYLTMLGYQTPTRRIFHMLDELRVKDVDLHVSLDSQGRISSVKGKASFTLIDKQKNAHELSVDFDGVAFDYGQSHVEAFNPEAYGVISAYEYYNGNYSINDIDAAPLTTKEPEPVPKSIVFDGVEYQIYN